MVNINKRIATTLKKLRKERAWSLDKTAKETGVSKAMLGQIERGESSPTVATLWKIANGFHTSFSSLLDNIPVKSRNPLQFPDKNAVVNPIFPFDKELQCEIFLIELHPTSVWLSEPHESGVIEHVLVVEGTLDIKIKGKWTSLKKGEGLRFDASKPHGYRNSTNKPSSFHNIIHYSSVNNSSKQIR